MKDLSTLNFLKDYLKPLEGPFLEIGPGKGSITEYIPDPKLLVEPQRIHEPFLKDQRVLWTKIQKLYQLPLGCKTLVSNLPFDQSMSILIHCAKYFHLKDYVVIVPKSLIQKVCGSKSKLAHKFHHLFNLQILRTLKSSFFNPKPSIEACLVHLNLKNSLDWTYVEFLNRWTSPRKILKIGCSTKRIDQYDFKELYDLFKTLT